MIFEFDLIDSISTRERLLLSQIENIATNTKRIVEYARIYNIKINKIMIVRINKYRKSIEYEIENFV